MGAIHFLLLDEVLSVGDASFKKKSKKRMEKLLKRDITVIVVSHNLKFVQKWCKKAIWLEEGQIKFFGSAEETTEHHLSSIGKKK